MKNTVMIKSNDLFLKLYRRGKRSYHKYFTLYYLPNGLAENRLGIHVGKKVGGAVLRNRLKRVLKESYRLEEDKLRKGFDLVFSARESASEIPSRQIAGKALFHLTRTAGLMAAPAQRGAKS